MENYIKIRKLFFSFLLALIFYSCEQEPLFPQEGSNLTEREQLISGEWQYESLVVDGDTMIIINNDFEPGVPRNEFFNVQRRWFEYFENKSYEFRWDVTDADWKIGDTLNYQPNLGYWKLNESEDTLIHNFRDSFATPYHIIELNEELFIREYQRVVQFADDTVRFKLGDTVVYREILVPRIR